MKKLVCIVGPTASGKTTLAQEIFTRFEGLLISADSRQVYREMDIVTGKDHDPKFPLLGIDIVDPDEDCSVAVWYDSISKSFTSASSVIAVGGTGLYFRALTSGIETMSVPPDEKLRESLASISVSELQSMLSTLSPDKLSSMNNSDVNNPRRLVRAIEVARANNVKTVEVGHKDILFIGLKYADDELYKKIILERVNSRLELGAIQETESLVSKYGYDISSLTAIGYKSILQYLSGSLTYPSMVDKWVQDELAYAKRQMTWFRKVAGIKWYDVGNRQVVPSVVSLLEGWYDSK